jgi:H/ACA ribonucleoprotein complex subunit 1
MVTLLAAAELGTFMHACQSEMVCKCTLDGKVPHFNTGVYTENIEKLGKIEEVFGPINNVVRARPTRSLLGLSF